MGTTDKVYTGIIGSLTLAMLVILMPTAYVCDDYGSKHTSIYENCIKLSSTGRTCYLTTGTSKVCNAKWVSAKSIVPKETTGTYRCFVDKPCEKI